VVDGATKVLLLRVGEARQGVIGLYQPGLPGERGLGLSVRFMGISRNAIASYLISLYCSLAVLTPDALGCPRRRASRQVPRLRAYLRRLWHLSATPKAPGRRGRAVR